ncbi:hypothetical protein HDU67_005525 [Dinochytrium kinnereticum]|nr:hypothetical protein HDU67_005525 [Dinochytrium kinnereticum]
MKLLSSLTAALLLLVLSTVPSPAEAIGRVRPTCKESEINTIPVAQRPILYRDFSLRDLDNDKQLFELLKTIKRTDKALANRLFINPPTVRKNALTPRALASNCKTLPRVISDSQMFVSSLSMTDLRLSFATSPNPVISASIVEGFVFPTSLVNQATMFYQNVNQTIVLQVNTGAANSPAGAYEFGRDSNVPVITTVSKQAQFNLPGGLSLFQRPAMPTLLRNLVTVNGPVSIAVTGTVGVDTIFSNGLLQFCADQIVMNRVVSFQGMGNFPGAAFTAEQRFNGVDNGQLRFGSTLSLPVGSSLVQLNNIGTLTFDVSFGTTTIGRVVISSVSLSSTVPAVKTASFFVVPSTVDVNSVAFFTAYIRGNTDVPITIKGKDTSTTVAPLVDTFKTFSLGSTLRFNVPTPNIFVKDVFVAGLKASMDKTAIVTLSNPLPNRMVVSRLTFTVTSNGVPIATSTTTFSPALALAPGSSLNTTDVVLTPIAAGKTTFDAFYKDLFTYNYDTKAFKADSALDFTAIRIVTSLDGSGNIAFDPVDVAGVVVKPDCRSGLCTAAPFPPLPSGVKFSGVTFLADKTATVTLKNQLTKPVALSSLSFSVIHEGILIAASTTAFNPPLVLPAPATPDAGFVIPNLLLTPTGEYKTFYDALFTYSFVTNSFNLGLKVDFTNINVQGVVEGLEPELSIWTPPQVSGLPAVPDCQTGLCTVAKDTPLIKAVTVSGLKASLPKTLTVTLENQLNRPVVLKKIGFTVTTPDGKVIATSLTADANIILPLSGTVSPELVITPNADFKAFYDTLFTYSYVTSSFRTDLQIDFTSVTFEGVVQGLEPELSVWNPLATEALDAVPNCKSGLCTVAAQPPLVSTVTFNGVSAAAPKTATVVVTNQIAETVALSKFTFAVVFEGNTIATSTSTFATARSLQASSALTLSNLVLIPRPEYKAFYDSLFTFDFATGTFNPNLKVDFVAIGFDGIVRGLEPEVSVWTPPDVKNLEAKFACQTGLCTVAGLPPVVSGVRFAGVKAVEDKIATVSLKNRLSRTVGVSKLSVTVSFNNVIIATASSTFATPLVLPTTGADPFTTDMRLTTTPAYKAFYDSLFTFNSALNTFNTGLKVDVSAIGIEGVVTGLDNEVSVWSPPAVLAVAAIPDCRSGLCKAAALSPVVSSVSFAGVEADADKTAKLTLRNRLTSAVKISKVAFSVTYNSKVIGTGSKTFATPLTLAAGTTSTVTTENVVLITTADYQTFYDSLFTYSWFFKDFQKDLKVDVGAINIEGIVAGNEPEVSVWNPQDVKQVAAVPDCQTGLCLVAPDAPEFNAVTVNGLSAAAKTVDIALLNKLTRTVRVRRLAFTLKYGGKVVGTSNTNFGNNGPLMPSSTTPFSLPNLAITTTPDYQAFVDTLFTYNFVDKKFNTDLKLDVSDITINAVVQGWPNEVAVWTPPAAENVEVIPACKSGACSVASASPSVSAFSLSGTDDVTKTAALKISNTISTAAVTVRKLSFSLIYKNTAIATAVSTTSFSIAAGATITTGDIALTSLGSAFDAFYAEVFTYDYNLAGYPSKLPVTIGNVEIVGEAAGLGVLTWKPLDIVGLIVAPVCKSGACLTPPSLPTTVGASSTVAITVPTARP